MPTQPLRLAAADLPPRPQPRRHRGCSAMRSAPRRSHACARSAARSATCFHPHLDSVHLGPRPKCSFARRESARGPAQSTHSSHKGAGSRGPGAPAPARRRPRYWVRRWRPARQDARCHRHTQTGPQQHRHVVGRNLRTPTTSRVGNSKRPGNLVDTGSARYRAVSPAGVVSEVISPSKPTCSQFGGHVGTGSTGYGSTGLIAGTLSRCRSTLRCCPDSATHMLVMAS